MTKSSSREALGLMHCISIIDQDLMVYSHRMLLISYKMTLDMPLHVASSVPVLPMMVNWKDLP